MGRAKKKENSHSMPEPDGLMKLDRLEEIILLQEMLALQLIPQLP